MNKVHTIILDLIAKIDQWTSPFSNFSIRSISKKLTLNSKNLEKSRKKYQT